MLHQKKRTTLEPIWRYLYLYLFFTFLLSGSLCAMCVYIFICINICMISYVLILVIKNNKTVGPKSIEKQVKDVDVQVACVFHKL